MSYPIDSVRADFPMLRQRVHGKPYVYLDTAATALKPQQVIDRLSRFYAEEYGTVRRGVYHMSQQATGLYEGVRRQVARFIGTDRSDEIVFVRGVTEAMNLIATGWARKFLRPGDEVLLSAMEHHSNIVPWQLAAAATGAVVRAVPFDDRGEIDLDALDGLLNERTRLVSVVHVSNSLGTVNPVAEIARRAHRVGAVVVVDGAQSAPHLPIDVPALGCDFFAASGHKMLGPTGAGFLWGRYALLESMDPWQGGGEMIDRVTFEGSTWEDPPHRFEAGTPSFADVIAMGEALSYLERLGMDAVARRDDELVAYALDALQQVPGLHVFGAPAQRSGLIPFGIRGIHPLDIGTVLDREGIAIRVGQHCTQPVMDRLGVHSTARASFGVYTTHGDIDALVTGLNLAAELLG